jgi:FKBP-type peptidyl-prolyl cis-trans isomerase SlyD
MIQVGKNRIVTIRYIMQNSRGDVLENTMGGPSASYLHGGSGILPSLQGQLEGLTPGERKQVFLFRDRDAIPEDFSFDVWIEKIREALPQEQALGYPLTGMAVECAPGCTCYY